MKRSSGQPLCTLPWHNMLIDQQGHIRICCHGDYDAPIGKYPENNLHDIWFGEERRRMTGALSAGRIPAACASCIRNNIPHPVIVTAEDPSFSAAFTDWPGQIEFLLEHRCNLNCIMCTSRNPLSAAEINAQPDFGDDFIAQIKPFLEHLKFAVFSGGEPFMIAVYEKLWALLRAVNPNAGLYVQTNGSLLNDRIKSWIETYDLQIGVSLDSLDPATYAQIRENASLENVLTNLEYFITCSRKQKRPLTLMFTPMTLNIAELPAMLDFCEEKQLQLSISPLERPARLALWTLDPVALQELLMVFKTFQKEHHSLSRNREVLTGMIAQLSGFRDEKIVAGAHCHEELIRIRHAAEHIQTAFTEALRQHERDTGDSRLTGLLERLLAEMRCRFADRFPCDGFEYLLLQNRTPAAVAALFAAHGEAAVIEKGTTRLDDLLVMVENHAFSRLDI